MLYAFVKYLSMFSVLCSVQFSHSVLSDSLRPHGLQHTRLPCPSPSPGAWSNSCHWISESIQPSHPLSSPSPAFNISQHQGLFLMSQPFSSGGQSIEVSASASVLPINIQDWFPLGLTVWSPCSPSQESSPTPQFKSINSLTLSLLYSPIVTSIGDYWKKKKKTTTKQNIALTIWTFVWSQWTFIFPSNHHDSNICLCVWCFCILSPLNKFYFSWMQETLLL